ncbi:MAG: hypothetical protein KF725_10385 [Cyclobacteriaceae bacterium]|nr:hypothetical protein [Cyclobacteriaceae bacterium]
MERIRTLLIQGKEIVAIDYSNLKEADMIALAIDAKKYLMKTEGPKFIINSYSKTFITPAYVRHMEKDYDEVKNYINRNALVGLNTPKMMILKGFNLLLGTDFRTFATEREAIEYLIGAPVVEELKPIFVST